MADAQLTSGDDIKSHLVRTNEWFRQLVTEHQALDEKIRQFSRIAFLTDEQQYEETSLKKQKLVLKDRIEAALRGHSMGGMSPIPSQ